MQAFSTIQFLIVCKNRGGRLGLLYHVNGMNDVIIYLSRQRRGGIPEQKNELEAFPCSICPSAGLEFCKVKNLPLVV